LTKRKASEAKLQIARDAAVEKTETLKERVVDALLPRSHGWEFLEIRECLPSGVLLKSTDAVLSPDLIIDLLLTVSGRGGDAMPSGAEATASLSACCKTSAENRKRAISFASSPKLVSPSRQHMSIKTLTKKCGGNVKPKRMVAAKCGLKTGSLQSFIFKTRPVLHSLYRPKVQN
jgi:hypothetical protein